MTRSNAQPRLDGPARRLGSSAHTSLGTEPLVEGDEGRAARAAPAPSSAAGLEDEAGTLGFTGGERVLDAACGTGRWAIALAGRCAEVHGVDRSAESVSVAETLARHLRLENAYFTHGSIESLPFPDGYFSAVLYAGPPSAELRRALPELARVLGTDGVVLVGLEQRRRMRRAVVAAFRPRRRLERAAQAAGLRVEAPADRGSRSWLELRPTGSSAAASAGRAQPVEPPSADELRSRGGDFERRVAERPSGLTIVPIPAPGTPVQYAGRRIEDVRARLRGIDQDACLDALVARTTAGAWSPQDAVERVIRLLQDSFFHDPVEQPPVELSPLELLLLGDGRCGHVAAVAVDLLRRAGFPARIRQLPRHIVAEAFLDGDWRIVDPDAFKNGVVPAGADGRLLSFRELELDPYRIDRFPMTGFWVRPGTRYTRNPEGAEITGYVDSIPPEERGFPSSLYAWWVPPEYPPSVPRLREADVSGRSVHLAWSPSTDRDGDLRGYRVRVGTVSRGWSYDHAVYERLLDRTSDDVARFETTAVEADIEVPGPGLYHWSVEAVDAHVDKEPDTFYWSSDEGSFRVP